MATGSSPLPIEALDAAIAALLGEPREVISIAPAKDDFAFRSGAAGEHVVSFRDGDGERHAVLRRLDGRVPAMREEGVHVVAGERLVDARRELGVAWIARPGGVVALTLLPEAPSYLSRLRHLLDEGVASDGDLDDTREVARALVRHHKEAPDRSDAAYLRAVRDLFEGATGLHASLDAIPTQPRGPVTRDRLASLEKRFVTWRWKRKPQASRLRLTHGDALPWSFAFGAKGPELLYTHGPLLADAAADVGELAAWLFAAAAREPVAWEDGLLHAWDTLWSTYLGESGDHELLDVIPPYLAARVLSYASAARDPGLSLEKREHMIAFAEATLDGDSFDPDRAKSLVR